jgi:protein O-mannosyl-transferase
MQRINKTYFAFILFFLSILFFFRTVHYKAVWDDERAYFTPANQEEMNTNLSAFWKARYGMYIPVTNSTWGIVKRVASPKDFNPAPFHALNIITHGINGVLLFYLLLLLFKNNTPAFLGALLFLIHPLQVEAVAWISEFRGLYAAFFCLISLLFFFSYLEKKRPEKLSELIWSKGFFVSLGCFVLALLAKPTVVILPFIILILVWRFYPKQTKTVAISLFTWLLPIIIIVFFLLIKGVHVSVPILERFVIAGYALFFYLQKLILPFPLAACYGYSPTIVIASWFSYIALVLCIAFIYLLVIKRHKVPDLFASVFIIVVCLLPVLGLIPFEYQQFSVVADRYIYMAFIGVALLMPALVKCLQDNSFLKITGVIVLGVLSILTIKQTATWKDEFTLWDHAVTNFDNNPNAYYNRGVQYSLTGDFENAITDYTFAFQGDSTNTDILFNRANAYENLKNYGAALNDYTTALKIDPKAGDVYYKRSHLFMMLENLDNALDDLQRAEENGFPVDPAYKATLLKLKYR